MADSSPITTAQISGLVAASLGEYRAYSPARASVSNASAAAGTISRTAPTISSTPTARHKTRRLRIARRFGSASPPGGVLGPLRPRQTVGPAAGADAPDHRQRPHVDHGHRVVGGARYVRAGPVRLDHDPGRAVPHRHALHHAARQGAQHGHLG